MSSSQNPPESSPVSGGWHPPVIGLGLAAAAVIALALLMRAPASGIGPILEEISASLAMSPSVSGLLTALPGFCFAAFGLISVALAQRIGLSIALCAASGALLLGGLARVLTDSWVLFLVLSVVTLAGIALANVLLPAWIKQYGGVHTVLLMTAYSTLVSFSGALGPFFAAPVAEISESIFSVEGWRGSLAFWALLALIPLALWLTISRRTGRDMFRAPITSTRQIPVWRSKTVLALTGLFAFQSANAYVQFGWLPQIFRDAGLDIALAGTMSALAALVSAAGGLVMPSIVARSKNLSGYIIFFGVCTATGYFGLILAPAELPWLWALFLGLGAFAFTTSIALIPARTRDPLITAKVSGFVQSVGYLVAALIPLFVGVAYEASANWTPILIAMMGTGLLKILCGLHVAKPTIVDDSLTPPQPEP